MFPALITYTNGDLEEITETSQEVFDDLPGVRDVPRTLAEVSGMVNFWAMLNGYTIDLVKEFDPCTWLVLKRFDSEDVPEDRQVNCGAPVHVTKHVGHGDGWACSAGHSHEPLSLQWEPYGSAWQEEIREKRAEGYDLTESEIRHFKG